MPSKPARQYVQTFSKPAHGAVSPTSEARNAVSVKANQQSKLESVQLQKMW